MSVENESVDRNVQLLQNVQPFQIQYSNFQNPPINQNPYPMANVLSKDLVLRFRFRVICT